MQDVGLNYCILSLVGDDVFGTLETYAECYDERVTMYRHGYDYEGGYDQRDNEGEVTHYVQDLMPVV